MKIAVCFSGAFRQFKTTYPTFKKCVLDAVDAEFDIYFSTFNNQIPHFKKQIKDDGSIKDVLALYKPKACNFEVYDHFKRQELYKETRCDILQKELNCKRPHKGPKCRYCGSDIIHNQIGMLYNMKKSFEIIENPEDYDYIIRTRFDNYHYTPITQKYYDAIEYLMPGLCKISIPAGYDDFKEYGPGINDQFAFGNYCGMSMYMRAYDGIYNYAKLALKEYGVNGIPHHTIHYMLVFGKVQVMRPNIRYVIEKKRDLFLKKGGLTMGDKNYAELRI